MSESTDAQNISKVKEICDACGELFERLGITATVIIKHPEIAEDFIFQNCHFYDAAMMISKAYANIREQISKDIIV